MQNPVITSCGYTFERNAIEDWASKYNFSPMTNQDLLKIDGRVLMIPNQGFKALAAQLTAVLLTTEE